MADSSSMREVESEVGFINLEADLGLCGHPGLTAEIYRLPLNTPGTYRVTEVTDELQRRRRITLLLAGCSEATLTLGIGITGITNQSHGGIMLGEFARLEELRLWLEDDPETSGRDVWNEIAEGFGRHIKSLPTSPGMMEMPFAMIGAGDGFCARPLLRDGKNCGYSILCHCSDEGTQLDVRPNGWEKIEAPGELPGGVNSKGFVKCPHCGLSFNSTSSSWNGFRHTRCWGKIKLVPAESLPQ